LARTRTTPGAEVALLSLRVQPRASRDEIIGWQDATLRLRVTAPPVGGAANTAVARLLARALDVPFSAIRVVRGLKGRDKVVEITGLAAAELHRRLTSQAKFTTGATEPPAAAETGGSEPLAPDSGHPRSKPASRHPLQ
jgi:uncharacterized protein